MLNGGTTTEYFLLGRGVRQGDPISTFLCILALDILFYLIKSKSEIKRLAIFDHCYLYSAYANDILFLYLILFSYFSGLKPNLAKSEIVGIGVLKGVQVAVCGMHCIGLNNDTLKNIRYPFLLQ